MVEPELLDYLPADDPQALGSRGDLRRVNTLMGHADILTQAFRENLAPVFPALRPLRIVDLGAGDGTLLLGLAQLWSALGVRAEVTLLDRQQVVSDGTRSACAALGWSLQCLAVDVFAGLERASAPVDVMLANLFLHHFKDEPLRALLQLAADRTALFLACEPRRSPLALAASCMLGCIGCNAVTRCDAVASVHAGFEGAELSALWPTQNGWRLSERNAGMFSHCFVARREA